MNCIIIGIAGGTGSGKSTFTNRLKEEFGDRVSVVYYDNYYKAHDDIPLEERALINYDHPDSFETDLIVSHLESLRNGESIDCPVYDYSIHNRTDRKIHIHPAEVIIVEGILVLYDERLKNMMDIKIYVGQAVSDDCQTHALYFCGANQVQCGYRDQQRTERRCL